MGTTSSKKELCCCSGNRGEDRFPKSHDIMLSISVPADPPEARGLSHGAQLSAEIAALWLAWTTSLDSTSGASPGSSQRAALSYAEQVWPIIPALAPESAVEIKAIATAANQPLLVIVALNCYDEIGLVAPLAPEVKDPRNTEFRGHCTGVSLGWETAGAGAVLGQSWDCPLYYRPVVLLKVVSQEGSADQVHLTFPGIVAGPCMSAKMAIG